MTNIIESFFGKVLNDLITSIAKDLKEQSEIQEQERIHKKLKEGSIDVEFKITEITEN